jgi:HK97 family phage major capsid protein
MTPEIKAQFDELQTVVATFRDEVKTGRGASDEKLTKLNDRIDELETKMNRTGSAGQPSEQEKAKGEHRKAFERFVRKGNDAGLAELQQKAMSVGSDEDGGYAVPVELDRAIMDRVAEVSPIRQIASVITVGSDNYEKLVNIHGTASGWVGETDARSVTAAAQFKKLTPYMGEIYANPAVTQRMLDDAMFNVEQFLSNEVSLEFATEEAAGFISGDGSNKPKGFTAYTTAATADGSRTFGQLEHVKTGVNGAFAASNPELTLVDLVYALKASFRQNARWVLAKDVLRLIRRMQDGNDAFIWQPGLAAGQPSTILGYSVTEAEDMPALATNSLSVAFGDFKRGYAIVDRFGTRTLRDPYTNKPYVHFYSTKRVGGFVQDDEAIKLIKFAA